MTAKLSHIMSEKGRLLKELFDLLVADGYRLDFQNVVKNNKTAEGRIIPARKTIARELVRKGYASCGDECYEKILNTPRYRKYAKAKPSIKEGIKAIHDCGGFAIWAHPFGITRGGKKEISKEELAELFNSLDDYGIDGLEVFYHGYTLEQIKHLNQFTDEQNKNRKVKLLKSIGTDFHTPIHKPEYKAPALQVEVDRMEICEDIVKTLTNHSG